MGVLLANVTVMQAYSSSADAEKTRDAPMFSDDKSIFIASSVKALG